MEQDSLLDLGEETRPPAARDQREIDCAFLPIETALKRFKKITNSVLGESRRKKSFSSTQENRAWRSARKARREGKRREPLDPLTYWASKALRRGDANRGGRAKPEREFDLSFDI